MKKQQLPKTDSIRKLAEFWDAHDLTDFEAELEEPSEPVFNRRRRASSTEVRIPLESSDVERVDRLARSTGVSREQLIREWVLQKIARPGNGRTKR